MKIVVLILTCLVSMPRDECTRDTAVDVREVEADSVMQCAMAGISTAAADPRSSEGLWTKISCGHATIEERAANGGP